MVAENWRYWNRTGPPCCLAFRTAAGIARKIGETGACNAERPHPPNAGEFRRNSGETCVRERVATPTAVLWPCEFLTQ
jgi:hypothetical protein